MEELREAREETERVRREGGAFDLRAGEVEGMRGGGEGDGVGAGKSRAMEKRKREMEERRKMLDAKRRKVIKGDDTSSESVPTFEARAGGETIPAPTPADPFAALETKSKTKTKFEGKGKGKGKAVGPDADAADADDFLAELEKEMFSGSGKGR